jgi:hypothetical protein
MQNWWTRKKILSLFKSEFHSGGAKMTGKKTAEKPQGFVIVADDYNAKNWGRMYVSKFGGDKKEKICGPHKLEILRAVQECSVSCRRVILLTRAYPVGSDRETLVRDMRGYYPEIEVVYMACT